MPQHSDRETALSADPVQAFGIVLRRVRKAKGLTQEELAFKAHIHNTHISQLENGKEKASILTIFCLANALGLKPHELIIQTEEELSREHY